MRIDIRLNYCCSELSVYFKIMVQIKIEVVLCCHHHVSALVRECSPIDRHHAAVCDCSSQSEYHQGQSNAALFQNHASPLSSIYHVHIGLHFSHRPSILRISTYRTQWRRPSLRRCFLQVLDPMLHPNLKGQSPSIRKFRPRVHLEEDLHSQKPSHRDLLASSRTPERAHNQCSQRSTASYVGGIARAHHYSCLHNHLRARSDLRGRL